MATPTFDAWLEGRGLSANTRKQYVSRARKLEDADDAEERAIDLLVGKAGRGYAPKSRRMMSAAFRAWARWKGDLELIERISELKLPPATRAKAQVPLPAPVYRAVRDEIASADYLDDAQRAVLGLLACRGLRRSDALRLKRVEVMAALKQNVLSYEMKGGKRLEIGLLPSYRPYLELLALQTGRWTIAADLVSSSWDGAEQAIPYALRRVAESVELGDDVAVEDVRCHVLRRSYAVAYYEACGRDPVKLQHHLGWSNVTTALSYVDFARRDDLDAVAAAMTKDW